MPVWMKDLLSALLLFSLIYFVGKPLAEAMAVWITRASPDKFLELVISWQVAAVAIVLYVGRNKVHSVIDLLAAEWSRRIWGENKESKQQFEEKGGVITSLPKSESKAEKSKTEK